MIKSYDAISAARTLIGTPYSEVDCIGLIKKVIRTAPGGVPGYTTAGTNTLWRSYDSAPKYKDLTWRQESTVNARPGMLAFKRSGDDVHHVGIVTEDGTVIHSSSARGVVVETELNDSWHMLAIHRHIDAAANAKEESPMYKARVTLEDPMSALNLRAGPAATDKKIGSLHHDDVVDVLAESGDWRFVRMGAQSGYASAKYLERVDEEEEPEEAVHIQLVFTDSAGNTWIPVGDFKATLRAVED